MVPRPKKARQAKCVENQAALDRLAEKLYQIGDGSNYQYAIKRAMDSLASCTEPITSYKQALSLKYVGVHCAMVIYPPNKNDTTNNNDSEVASVTTKTTATSASVGQGTKKSKTNSNKTSNSIALSIGEKQTKQKDVPKPNNQSKENIPPIASSTSVNLKQTSLHSIGQPSVDSNQPSVTKQQTKRKRPLNNPDSVIDFKPSGKEGAYNKAFDEAEKQTYRNRGYTWRVVLIIDGREQKSHHVQAKCQMSGIPCEERMLPIGDMAWIAQGYLPGNNKNNSTVMAEIMLGTIIERKTIEDLKGSLFGTRYFEQRLRLQNSGIPQILFLIEGNMNKELFRCSSETIHTAVWETRVHLNFAIVHTAHLDDTVLTLKRMHRRILQRTFPTAFYDEALPTFQELYSSTNNNNSTTNARQNANNDNRRESTETNGSITPHQGRRQRRRCRRRVQSLVEMTFDTDPVPPLGTSRFITYQELKTKIERDREVGTKTIGSIHRAMLKQVPTWNVGKCQALASIFPTMNSLLQQYSSFSKSNNYDLYSKQMMVSNVPLYEPGKNLSTTNRTIGQRSSAELYVAYGVTNDDTVSNNNETTFQAGTSKVLSYSELLDQIQLQQTYQVQDQSSIISGVRLSQASDCLSTDVLDPKLSYQDEPNQIGNMTGLPGLSPVGSSASEHMLKQTKIPYSNCTKSLRNGYTSRDQPTSEVEMNDYCSGYEEFKELEVDTKPPFNSTTNSSSSIIRMQQSTPKHLCKDDYGKHSKASFMVDDTIPKCLQSGNSPDSTFTLMNGIDYYAPTMDYSSDRKNRPCATTGPSINNTVDLSMTDDESDCIQQETTKQQRRHDLVDTSEQNCVIRTSYSSKKTYRSSLSSGFYTSGDDIPLNHIINKRQESAYALDTPVEKIEADELRKANASIDSFGDNSSQESPVVRPYTSKPPPSSLLKSLDEALYSCSDIDDDDDDYKSSWRLNDYRKECKKGKIRPSYTNGNNRFKGENWTQPLSQLQSEIIEID